MNWFFPKNDGGQENGLHDPGVETFKGDFDKYLAREVLQNSLDAIHDPNKPVLVKFELLEYERNQLPDIDALTASFSRCCEYWGSDPKANQFFIDAKAIANKEKIVALKIGDFNTHGLLGSDTDKDKNWYNLIKCSGSSSKRRGEGGSFGIGKNAPFAASLMQTVFYSTHNTDNENIFQGVAKLASHELPDGGKAQSIGYLGNQGASVRDKSQIPEYFLRSEYGTDIIILGFRADETWKEDLIYSVLEHFWPAMNFGTLEVIIGKEKISKNNLKEYLENYDRKYPEFTAYKYYEAFEYSSNHFHKELPTLKNVDVYLKTGNNNLPKRVAMVRKTGMVIFPKHFRCIVPYAGVFFCRNEEGNEKLREMEPPQHNLWDPNLPNKSANKGTLKEYEDYIRECLKELNPVSDSSITSIPELSKYLPDDGENLDDASNKQNKVIEESFELVPKPDVRFKKINFKEENRSWDLGDPNYSSGDPEEPGIFHGPGKGLTKKKNKFLRKLKRAARKGKGKKKKANENKITDTKSKPTIPINYRSFVRNLNSGVYALLVGLKNNYEKEFYLKIEIVGDDGVSPANLKEARTYTGSLIKILPNGFLGPLKLNKSEKLKLEIILQEPMRASMEVIAYENNT